MKSQSSDKKIDDKLMQSKLMESEVTESKVMELIGYCHELADLLDRETALINKNKITELPSFSQMKSCLANNFMQIENALFEQKKIDIKQINQKYPELYGAQKRLAKTIERNQLALSQSKNLLEALLRHLAQKATEKTKKISLYAKDSTIVKNHKKEHLPITCNKIS